MDFNIIYKLYSIDYDTIRHLFYYSRHKTDMELPSNVLELLAVTIPLMIGSIIGARIVMNRPKTLGKYQKAKEKLTDEYVQELEHQMKKYKNKNSNMQRGPKIDDNWGGIIPEVIGSFSNYAPQWLKPFLGNKDIQGALIQKVQDNPEQFATLFSKLIKKPSENKADDIQEGL